MRNLAAIVYFLLCVLFSFAVVWFSRKAFGDDKVRDVALLLIPLIIYGVVSGRLAEFSGPGGWSAKFREAASATVSPSSSTIDLTESDFQNILKTTVADLEDKIGEIREGTPLVMTIAIGKSGYYRSDALRDALHRLAQFRNFRFVVFVRQNRLVAYIPESIMRLAMDKEQPDEELVKAINDGDEDKLVSHPGMITCAISPTATNAEALREMERLGLEAILVRDNSNRVVGVVDRGRTAVRMVMALAGEGRSDPPG